MENDDIVNIFLRLEARLNILETKIDSLSNKIWDTKMEGGFNNSHFDTTHAPGPRHPNHSNIKHDIEQRIKEAREKALGKINTGR